MVDDYYPPTDDEPQQQPQQPQLPEGFVPYQATSSLPEGFVPYKSELPEGFVPYTSEPSLPPPIKSAPPTATDEERRVIYGDEPLGTPSARGGLTPRREDTPPILPTNKAGQTFPGYILRALGEGLAAIPERVTRSSGQLQRQGDVYDPAPAVDVMSTMYGARALAGGLKFRPIPTEVPRPAGPRVTPEGQYQLPLEGAHQPGFVRPPVDVEGPLGPRQTELLLGPPVEDALKRQGQTPGSTAAPGVAQEPNPPARMPVADAQNKATLGDGAMETGGENLNTRDYGKTTPAATGDATGVNVLKDGVDPTLASTFKPAEPPAAAARPPPEAPAAAPPPEAPVAASRPPSEATPTPAAGLLPEKQPFYDAAKAAAPNLSHEQLVHIADLAGGPKGAALMARNTARRLAEGAETPTARVPVPEGTMELPPVEVRPPGMEVPPKAAEAIATSKGQQFAPQEQFGGQAPPRITPTARPIEPTGRPVPEGARAEINTRLDQTMSVADPAVHLRETATRARELGLEGQARRIEAAATELERQHTVEVAPGPGERSTGTLRQQQEGIVDRVRKFIADERGAFGRRQPPRTPAEEKVLSRLAEEPGLLDNLPQSKAEASSAWRKFYTQFKNELDPIEQLKHRSLTDVPVHEDPGVLARLTRGLGGRINQVLEDGTYSVRTRQITGDPLRTVMDKIAVDPAGFDAYAMARNAIERDAIGVKTGIDLQAARQVVAQSGAKWGPVLKELNGWEHRMLDTAVDILGPKAVAAIKGKFSGHIALHRLVDPESGTAGLLGGGLQARNPLHRLSKEGSEALILNVRDSTIKDGVALLDMAERNRVGMAMEDLNAKLGSNSKFLREVKDVHPIDISAAEVNKHLGVEGITEQVADGFKVFRKDAFTPAPDRIRVFRDGKAKVYEVDPELGKAYHALNYQSLGMVTKILGAPARWLRAGSVLTPEFIVKNLLRDQIAAFTQAKGFVPGLDTATGLKNLLPGKSSEAFQRWQIEGGANANLVSMDRKIFHQDPRTALQHVGNVINTPVDLLRAASEVAENSTRLGVYERGVKQGMHPIAATFESREGTIDFQRRGSSLIQKALNDIIPFYNVALEGTDRTLRAFRDRPVATTLKTAAGITVPSILLWAATKDDERVQQVERWQKDIAWIIPGKDNWIPISTEGRNEILDGMVQRMPGLDISNLTHTFRQAPDGSWQYNNGNIWRLPKPPGIGQLFGSIPERILDAYVKHDPTAYKELGKTIWSAFAPNLSPQLFVPEIERWANRSIFLDNSLVSQPMQKLPTSQQIKPGTSEVAKTIGNVIRKVAGNETTLGSPIIVDNYIRAWTGGLGKHVTDLLDLGMRDKDAPPKPAMSAADVPLLKAFVARYPSSGAPAIQQFYDTYKERQTAAAGIKNLQKTGQPADPDLLRENPVQGIHNALSTGFKTVRNIMNDKNMTPDDKRAALDLTYLFMIEKAKQGNKALEQSKRKPAPAELPPGFVPYQPGAQ